MNTKVDEKIIDRIRKLLAMSKDTGSPNEAAIAARRVEAMMRQYNLTAADTILGELKAKENLTKQNAKGNMWRKKARSIPKWSQTMAVYCCELFDCHVVQCVSREEGVYLQFMGYHTDVEVCIWTYTYLIEQCKRFSDKFIAQTPGASRSTRMAYHDGVARGVNELLRKAKADKDAADRGSSACTALVVAKRAAIEEAFGKINYRDTKGRQAKDAAAYWQGLQDGRSVNVNPKAVHDRSGPPAPALEG